MWDVIIYPYRNFNDGWVSLVLYRLAVVCAQSIETRYWIDNEDVVGAAPTGDAPTTCELSIIAYYSPTYIRCLVGKHSVEKDWVHIWGISIFAKV